MKEILRWLEEQDHNEVEGCFYCNKSLTIESHEEGGLLVYIDAITSLPIAYQWGGLIKPGILEVRADRRGLGIGKNLVEYCIEKARREKQCILQIQCKPSTSIPFWKRMGFCLYDHTYNYAFRILEYKHELPEDGTPVSVEINFYLERRMWEKDTAPLEQFTPAAVTVANTVYLADRVYIFCKPIQGDVVIELRINGSAIYRDKAKYCEAEELGVQTDDNVIFVDEIKLCPS